MRPLDSGCYHRNTKMGNPMCDQCSGTSGYSHIQEGNGFWPSDKTVHHSHEMGASSGRWEEPHPIYIDLVETAKRKLECRRWSTDVSLNIRSWQGIHALSQILTCLQRPCQLNLAAMSFCVACTEGVG